MPNDGGITREPVAPSRDDPPEPRRGAAPAWTWAFGLVLGVAIVGPGLSADALLNLDLVVFDRMPAPDWWGIGPEVPRHGPLTAAIALLSQALPGPLLVSTVMALAVAVAFAGASRLASDSGVTGQVLAGMLYAAGPFMLTRIGVGHLGLVVAVALLPWALPTLLRPGDDLRRTFLWSLAFSATGYYGASLAVIAVATGLVADRFRRGAAVAGDLRLRPAPLAPARRVRASPQAPRWPGRPSSPPTSTVPAGSSDWSSDTASGRTETSLAWRDRG